MNGAVILDSRETPNIREAVENHMKYLPKWGLSFYHGTKNGDYVKEQLKGIDCTFVELKYDSFPWGIYNKICTSYEFWYNMPYRKVLMFHPDSGILRLGIDDFMKWDYIGAPWGFQEHGGNGGLSLRSRSVMVDIVRTFQYKNNQVDGNEDVWFSNIIKEWNMGKLAPRKECEKFAVESIFKLGTFGYHAPEKWLKDEEVNQIMNQYE